MKREEVEYILTTLLEKDKNKKIHISLNPKWFYNGIIKSINSKGLIIIDEKLGDTPVPYSLIINIELMIKK